MPGCFLGGDEHAANVDGQGPVEVFQLEVFQRADGQDAGIVDQDVQAAKGFDRAVDRLANGRGIGAVGEDRQPCRRPG